MRNDYRTRVKAMSDAELLRFIDRQLDYVLAVGDQINRLTYAETIAEKRGIYKPK